MIKKEKKKQTFLQTVRVSFETASAIDYAIVQAQQLSKRLSQRNPREAGEEYIDRMEVFPWVSQYGTMVLKMVTIKSFMQLAGLSDFIASALERIMNRELGPKNSSRFIPVKKGR